MRNFLEAVQSYVLEFCGDYLDADFMASLRDPIADEDVDKAITEIDNAVQVISKGLKGLDSIILNSIDNTPAPIATKPVVATKRTPTSADDVIRNWMAKHNL